MFSKNRLVNFFLVLMLIALVVVPVFAVVSQAAKRQNRTPDEPAVPPTATQPAAPGDELPDLRPTEDQVPNPPLPPEFDSFGASAALHNQTGQLRLLSFAEGYVPPGGLGAHALKTPEEVARDFLKDYGHLFGVSDATAGLNLRAQLADEAQRSIIRFQQLYEGLPVFGGELLVRLDRRNQLLSVVGETLPEPPAQLTPAISAQAAASIARQIVSKLYTLDEQSLVPDEPALWIYNALLLGLEDPHTYLVYRLEVSSNNDLPIRELVLIDALTGGLVLNFNQVDGAMRIKTYSSNNTSSLPGSFICDQTDPVCAAGDAHARAAHIYAIDAYNYFLNNHGRDSIDGAGMAVISSVHYKTNLDNAYWTGSQIKYGDARDWPLADDIVGHEFVHGITQYTSGLFYYYQSGAINESLSDMWGEFIDQTNGKGTDSSGYRWYIGEDIQLGRSLRVMKDPPRGRDPDKMTSPYYYLGSEDNGGVHINSGINNKAAYLMVDGGSFNGYTITGMGIPKVSKIYYEVQTNWLTSGSDYADLHDALYLACQTLIGSSGITAGNCEQVRLATLAVEMNLPPTESVSPEAAVCAPGEKTNALFFDDFEAGTGNWSFGTLQGTSRWGLNSSVYGRFAHSGSNSLYGADYPAELSNSFATLNLSFSLPPKTLLHFSHAHDLESGYDGGVLEYSIDGGSTWLDAGGLIESNGYNGVLWAQNPLGMVPAFTDSSRGYISTRANLSTLAGKNVQLRWRLGTDPTVRRRGWWLDDVLLYTCEPDNTIGEIGQIVEALTQTPRTITLSRHYLQPVVLLGPLSFAGSEAASVRITDIKPNSFTIQIQEAPGEDGLHAAESLSYMVIEAGMWQLSNGRRIAVGTLETSATVGAQFDNLWESASYGDYLPVTPVLFTTVQTNHDPTWVKTRVRNLKTTGFDVALEQAENAHSPHGTETIGWMAIERSSGTWSDRPYQALRLANQISGDWSTLAFSQSFSTPPRLIAGISTYRDPDPAVLRFRDLTAGGAQFLVQEDTTADGETAHGSEDLTYLAIEGSGMLSGTPVEVPCFPLLLQHSGPGSAPSAAPSRWTHCPAGSYTAGEVIQLASHAAEGAYLGAWIGTDNPSSSQLRMPRKTHTVVASYLANASLPFGEVGFVDDALMHRPFTINLQRSYIDPVIIAQPISYDGQDNAAVRILQVNPDSFTIYLSEPSNLNGSHTTESVSYMVVEAGVWQLADGKLVEARNSGVIGAVGRLFNGAWQDVAYQASFPTTPALLTQVRSHLHDPWVGTRQSNLSPSGFRVALEDEEIALNPHPPEVVGWVAIEPGASFLGALRFEGLLTGTSYTDQWRNLNFLQVYKKPPRFLGAISSYVNADSVILRYRALAAASVSLRVQEDQTADSETQHPAEAISYFAIQESGDLMGVALPIDGECHLLTLSHNGDGADPIASPTRSTGCPAGSYRSGEMILLSASPAEDYKLDTWVGTAGERQAHFLMPGSPWEVQAVYVPDLAPKIGEVGMLNSLTHRPMTVILQNTYSNPVIFAMPLSFNGADEAVVRISDVQADRFTLQIAEPSNLNNSHAAETVSYLVIEAGSWIMDDGAVLEAGTIYTNATVGMLVNNRWAGISFGSPFASAPVLLSQVQSSNQAGYLKTRHDAASTSGFRLALEGEEKSSAVHGPESVGWLALSPGSGQWDGLHYQASANGLIYGGWKRISFSQQFSNPPLLLAGLNSYQGANNASLRFRSLESGEVELRVEEDRTYDKETAHAFEKLALLAFSGSGVLTGNAR